MPWNDVAPAIGVDKPIRASTHLAMFENFAAMANGDPGAPRIRLPQAARTDETDQGQVLRPDGLGGVFWGRPPPLQPSWNSGNSRSTALAVGIGTRLVLAHGIREDDEDDNEVWSGWALVSASSILFQSSVHIRHDPDLRIGLFSIHSGGVYFMRSFGSVEVRILGIRIG